MRPLRWITGMARWPFRFGCLFTLFLYVLATGIFYSVIAEMLSEADSLANLVGAVLFAGWIAATASSVALLVHVHKVRRKKKG